MVTAPFGMLTLILSNPSAQARQWQTQDKCAQGCSQGCATRQPAGGGGASGASGGQHFRFTHFACPGEMFKHSIEGIRTPDSWGKTLGSPYPAALRYLLRLLLGPLFQFLIRFYRHAPGRPPRPCLCFVLLSRLPSAIQRDFQRPPPRPRHRLDH
jgi:hypothetical protein